MPHYELKIAPKHFIPLFEGRKTNDIRFDDRGYQIGDTVTFNEGQQELSGFEFTGRNISARVSYIDDFGCQHGYVNLSLQDIGLMRIG